MRMFAVLKQLMDLDKSADFLVPGFPQTVKGKVSRLSQDIAVVRIVQGGIEYDIIAHPDNFGVLQRA